MRAKENLLEYEKLAFKNKKISSRIKNEITKQGNFAIILGHKIIQ